MLPVLPVILVPTSPIRPNIFIIIATEQENHKIQNFSIGAIEMTPKVITSSSDGGMAAKSSSRPTATVNTIPELLEWNLIDRISPYLDRHMIFPLLDYFEKQIQEVGVVVSSSETKEDEDSTTITKATLLRDVNEARYKLLRPTHMIDYMMDAYNSSIVHVNASDNSAEVQSIHEEMTQQKQQVLLDLESLKQKCLPLLEGIDAATRVCIPSLSFLALVAFRF